MRWKAAVGTVTGLIVVAVAAVFVVVARFDFNDLKPRISKAVKDATGRELSLRGDVKLRIGLTPVLVVDDVSFQNAPWGSRPEMVTVKRFEMQAALLPLFSRRVEIMRFILVEPDVLIETDKSGQSNVPVASSRKDPAPSLEAKTGERSEEEGAGKRMTVSFKELQVEKGRFTYRDGASGKNVSVAVEKLAVSAAGSDSSLRLALQGLYNGKAFELAGTVGSLQALSDSAKPWPVDLSGKAGGATLTAKGEVKDPLHERSLALNLEARGPSLKETAGLFEVSSVPETGPFQIGGRLVLLKSELGIEDIRVEMGTEDLMKLKLNGSVKKPEAGRGVDIGFELTGNDVAKAGQLAGATLSAKGKFRFSGRVADSADRIYKVSNLEAVWGESDLSGTAELNLAGKKPVLDASLTSGSLDFRPSAIESGPKGAEGAAAPPAAGAKRDRVFSDKPFRVTPPKNLDAHIRLQAARILTSRMTLSNVAADMTLADGDVVLKPFKVSLAGGTVEGNVRLAGSGGSLDLQTAFNAKGIDLGRMEAELQAAQKFHGSLDLDVNVKGSGGSFAALMGGLDGRTVLRVSNGRFENKYLDLMGGDIASGALQLLDPLNKEEKTVEVNCFVSGFDIRGGKAQSTALLLDTRRMTVLGDGSIDLKTERLDISLNPSPKGGAGLKGVGKIGASLGALAKAVKVSGTLAKPSFGIDAEKAAMAIGKGVGGAALLGPAGAAASLAGGASEEGNQCRAALEAARKGVKFAGASESGEKKGLAEKSEQAVGDALGGAKGKLRKLFGR